MMERLNWEKIVEKYPDKWVVLANCVYDGVDIVEADVVTVLTDSEIGQYRLKHLEEENDLEYARTTERAWIGII